MRRKIANSLDIVLNLWCDLVVSNICTANRSFVICLFILTLAFSVILVVRQAHWSSLLVCWRVVVLNVLQVLVFIHDNKGRDICLRNLLCIQIGSGIPSCFGSPIGWIWVAWSGSNMGTNKFHSSSTTLAIDEVLHERIASLLSTACLGIRVVVHTLFVKNTLFPAIFQIFRSCAL